MRCQDVMKRPVELCHDYETVQTAARKMADANIGFMPICDRNERLIGTLTDRDIAVRLAAEDRTASETRIADVMTREIVSCSASDDLSEAERQMAAHRKSRIIVVADGAPIGVISLADLAGVDGKGAAQILRTIASREVLDAHGSRRRPSS
jgi:CBS domain-containing protein